MLIYGKFVELFLVLICEMLGLSLVMFVGDLEFRVVIGSVIVCDDEC